MFITLFNTKEIQQQNYVKKENDCPKTHTHTY